MRLVVIESPYAGATDEETEVNLTYLRAALHDCLMRGEAPYASHAIFPQPGVLNDKVPEERKLGIEAGFRWASLAEASVFYVDRGWSRGMLGALKEAHDKGRSIEVRRLGIEHGEGSSLATPSDEVIQRSADLFKTLSLSREVRFELFDALQSTGRLDALGWSKP
jgi:hypothetical protein